MTFDWALERMREGRTVRRQSWPRYRQVFIAKAPLAGRDMIMVRWEDVKRPGEPSIWVIPQQAVLATDWSLA